MFKQARLQRERFTKSLLLAHNVIFNRPLTKSNNRGAPRGQNVPPAQLQRGIRRKDRLRVSKTRVSHIARVYLGLTLIYTQNLTRLREAARAAPCLLLSRVRLPCHRRGRHRANLGRHGGGGLPLWR
jgi:hypothetical protein